MIEVRALQSDDWQLWRQLRLAALTDAPWAFGSTLAEWSNAGDTEARWRSRFDNVPYNAVISLDGTPAGMVGAYASDTEPGTVELISMWVAPFARGKGVSDAAIRAVLDWAYPRPVILSVKADNKAAIRLYERNGFTDAGPSPDDDERLMRRP
ncbi:GNAT family N-acetyltransferase [Nocardia sp. NPDC057668]|uniref:GNAT family N-acetyltransferase n=1 Tax=Nocardia sp. NPDC057668 TaxID=3346202 RepID=UPI003670EB67